MLSVPDLIITIAYFSIPLQISFSLFQYPRVAKKVVITKVVVLLVLFALFIFLCGAGHLMRCLDRADGPVFHVINFLTATVSLVTALYLIPFIPNLLLDLDESLLELSRSSKIIESMYPAPVRERLLNSIVVSSRNLSGSSSSQYSNDNNSINDSMNSNRAETVTRMKEFLRSTRRRRSNDSDSGGNNGRGCHELEQSIKTTTPSVSFSRSCYITATSAPPIALSFPAVSIMFADVVGFTKWASVHAPNDVFMLLESLFWQFDEIAKELGVFKICTVGDCYLAATGLPDAREDHASVLALFAERCRRKANEIVESLAEAPPPPPSTLQKHDGSTVVGAGSVGVGGDDTRAICMRFGIHSGPVMGGVLRGQKSRFELFGDTINTASRMESTGAPDRIQVSKQTADLIVEAGKSSWLVPREGGVKAKGKGELQTYWLTIAGPLEGEDEEVRLENIDVPSCSLGTDDQPSQVGSDNIV